MKISYPKVFGFGSAQTLYPKYLMYKKRLVTLSSVPQVSYYVIAKTLIKALWLVLNLNWTHSFMMWRSYVVFKYMNVLCVIITAFYVILM